jgi:hypothetical protein
VGYFTDADIHDTLILCRRVDQMLTSLSNTLRAKIAWQENQKKKPKPTKK